MIFSFKLALDSMPGSLPVAMAIVNPTEVIPMLDVHLKTNSEWPEGNVSNINMTLSMIIFMNNYFCSIFNIINRVNLNNCNRLILDKHK